MTNGLGELSGVVGVGRMGLAITKHLMKHGYRVIAQDIDSKAMNAAHAHLLPNHIPVLVTLFGLR